ncbi:hypothetical protein I7I51_05163 [Histoplasma capsulatum]|uniref:ethanolamine kinase n=1 Tax=Ajellomyces capsulatus TaxID=5037 RepID=A0A8A1M424_AJECA|nr:hypothetical protein I7I51_05163 [Histoplasma capsulatum]
MGSRNEGHASLRYIPLSYNQADSQASALRLVLTLNPHWEHSEGDIEFIRFTDGITNTLLKIIKRVPGLSDEQVDNDAVLMRAYGNHTEILIDRELLPIDEISPTSSPQERQETTSPARPTRTPTASTEVDDITPVKIRHAGTSFWSVLQKWILALPGGLVFAHCDLLSANVIVLPRGADLTPANATEDEAVSFIDYEYATPSPAAFDIANHFAEWAGYDCDFNKIPTQSVRKEFLTEYVKSYAEHSTLYGANQKDVVEKLFKDVDRFRGIPGFYCMLALLSSYSHFKAAFFMFVPIAPFTATYTLKVLSPLCSATRERHRYSPEAVYAQNINDYIKKQDAAEAHYRCIEILRDMNGDNTDSALLLACSTPVNACQSSLRTALRRPSLQTQVQRKPENIQNRKIPTQILFKRKMRCIS